MRFTRNQKLAMSSACLVAALLAAGIYLAVDRYYGKVIPVPEEALPVIVATPRVPVEIVPPLAPGADTYLKTDAALQRPDSPDSLSESSTNRLDDTNVGDGGNLGENDDDFPEDLKCPEKWIGVYLTNLSESELVEAVAHADAVAREIVQNHNPNRPLSEVWPLWIEAEKKLLSQSNAVLSDLQSPIAGRRIDWGYEQARRFPEIQALRFEEGPNGWMAHMYLVDMGHLDPDWNLVELPDERDFRVKYGRRYTFHTGKTTQGDKTGYGSFTICLSDPETAENIVIENYEQVSDAELERLGGWNYNINPYTGKQANR